MDPVAWEEEFCPALARRSSSSAIAGEVWPSSRTARQTPHQIAESLRELGLDIGDHEVLTPAVVAAETMQSLYQADHS